VKGRNATTFACVRGKIKPVLAALLLSCALDGILPAGAQVAVPNFWDPRVRTEKPDLTGLRTVRFLVDDEFPPLHFAGPDGGPTGFSVELARAACETLSIPCTVQVRRFDTLLDALGERNGDVVAAAIPITADLRQRFGVTAPYFRIPARFALNRGRNTPEPQAKALKGRSVAVLSGTAHEAYATAFMAGATVRPFQDLPAAEAALKGGEVDYLFADGLSLALWIGGTESNGCCALAGGPYLESRFFGEGIGFVVRKDEENLRRAFEFALQKLWDEGKYAEIYLRFFPVSPY
jgi:polar amino acid transport system substrate-binding protein